MSKAGAIMQVLFGKSPKKDSGIAIDQNLAGKIPYIKCYEDEGIIETKQGNYTKSYIIGSIDQSAANNISQVTARQSIALLFNDFPENVSFELSTHNMLISEEKYLKQILVVPDKEEEVNRVIEKYNAVISDNVGIGHNNIKKTTYLTISVKTAFVDDAMKVFRDLDGKIKARFKDIYNIEVKGLSLLARLRILYNIYNPGAGQFGEKIDLKGDGDIKLDNLRYMHLSTKDLVAPSSINSNYNLLDHLILNEGTENETYVRSFGITNIPRNVSDNVISDLTNVSSSMVYSTIYEPIDTQLGYETSKELVVKNTTTETRMKRSTVAERKAHATVQIKNRINQNEKAYFEEQALKLFQKNMAATQKTFAVTFVVTLFAPSIEDLNRDSDLLKLSADKFAFKLKSLDAQQLEGFQSVLPLCSSRIDLKRVIDIDRIVSMSPINIQDVIKKGGLYNGLNAINDNLILLNRRNNTNTNGLIAGVGTCGKTYQSKKEISNAAISSWDDISIITFGDEYDDFIRNLGGTIIDGMHTNLFEMVSGYGFTDRETSDKSDMIFKSYFLDALFVAMLDYKLSNRLLLNDDSTIDPARGDIDVIENEVAVLMKFLSEGKIDPTDEEAVIKHIRQDTGSYPTLNECLSKLKSSYALAEDKPVETGRIALYKVHNKTDLIAVLDHLRNKAVADLQSEKKKNSAFNWIFVDPIDCMLEDSASSDYLTEYLYKANLMKTVVTMVVQDSVRMITTPSALLPFEDLVNSCGYFKLLSQGPIERRKYIELLDIPQALTQYITNVEPGKGIIITSQTNVAFDDSFLEPDNEYHKLFAKEIKQIVLNEKLQARA